MPGLEASEPRLEDGHSDSDKARPQTDGFESRVPVVSDGTVAEAGKIPVIASGGVKEANDIRKLKPIGVAGVIVGRSLYEGTVTLKDALAAAK
jgi:phosphoribosylformimino-5-aminoimidazole carboxamide ribotide isomerase